MADRAQPHGGRLRTGNPGNKGRGVAGNPGNRGNIAGNPGPRPRRVAADIAAANKAARIARKALPRLTEMLVTLAEDSRKDVADRVRCVQAIAALGQLSPAEKSQGRKAPVATVTTAPPSLEGAEVADLTEGDVMRSATTAAPTPPTSDSDAPTAAPPASA